MTDVLAQRPVQSLSFRARVGDVTLDDSGIDVWELKAAQRALKNLKTLLLGQPMMDLLKNQIEASDRFHKRILADSSGRYRVARTDLVVPGFSAQQLVDSMVRGFQRGQDVQSILAAHPEHYVLPPQYQYGMVETIGGHPVRFKLRGMSTVADLPEAVASEHVDPDYPLTMVGVLCLDDDTVFAYAVHQLRDRDGSCEMALRLIYGAAAPDEMVQEHCEHLATEFRAFVRQAIAESDRD